MRYRLTELCRQAALDLLWPLAGGRPAIVGQEPVGREWAAVTRLTFDREIPGVGWTAVVKTFRVDGQGWGDRAHFRREQAGLRTAAGAGVTPRLIAWDDAAGVVLTADLGRWPTVESVLLGDDADAATRAMIGLGRAVGRLHAATVQAEALHRQALAAVATPQQGPEADRLGHWAGVDRWHIVEQATAALGLPDASAARVDVAVVLEHLRQPAPFAALVHMDLNPTNALVTPAGVKLVDFEGSIFGHIGVDASFLHYPFPNHSAHWATLPAEVTTEADRAYRRELAPTLPLDRYEQMRAVGAAAALAVRVHRLTKLAADGQPAADRWRRRAQLVQQIRVFEQLATQAECLPNLTGWFAQLADAMTHRWPDATTPPPPLYPAFHPSP